MSKSSVTHKQSKHTTTTVAFYRDSIPVSGFNSNYQTFHRGPKPSFEDHFLGQFAYIAMILSPNAATAILHGHLRHIDHGIRALDVNRGVISPLTRSTEH